MFSAARIVSLLLSFLAVVALAKESSRCPKMEDVVRYYQRYHAPQICDITSALTATMEQEREMSFERLTQERNFQLVPDEKTVVCPMAVESLPSEHDVVGMKTAWMVRTFLVLYRARSVLRILCLSHSSPWRTNHDT